MEYTYNFDEKYKMYGSMLFKLCMVYLGRKDEAEDAVQEAFIKLIYKSPSFSNIEYEKRWLIRIAINICKDMLRGFWKKNIVSLSDDFQESHVNAESWKFADMIIGLPEKYKAVVHLYYYENYTITEIADILHLGISAVKMRLKRGRDILKIELGEQS